MKYILGIDAGGTKIASGLVDSQLKVSKSAIQATSQTKFVQELVQLIETYHDFGAIALAVPGVVAANGFVRHLPNIRGFQPLNLKTYLARRFQVPVRILNDAQAFALAEAVLGVGKKAETVLGVILGTGIGSGLIRNKKIQKAKGLVGGEIGTAKLGDKLTLEQCMQQTGTSAGKLELIMKAILALCAGSVNPDIIVFGGGRTNYPGMSQLVKRLNPKARISKLKNAGIIGAALALKK